MSPEEKAERERLSRTPGLTKEQRLAVLDPEFPVRAAKIVLDTLRRQAEKFAAKSPEEKDFIRAMGGTEHVGTNAAAFDARTQVQTFGATVEVPRNG